MIPEIEGLPDVNFIGGLTLDAVQEQMVDAYKQRYKEITENECTLGRSDPMSLALYACSVQIFQALKYVDFSGKMDLLKYSYGDFLDNLAANKGISREAAKPASATVRFTLSGIRPATVAISAGTRVTNGTLYFETEDYAEIVSGKQSIDVVCVCQTAGKEGNGLLAGEINVLVDGIAYIASVSNTEETTGGADIEDDETLKERVYIAPSKYSVAGPEEAYVYWVKTFNSSISDVYVGSPEEGEVLVEFILENGQLPNEAMVTRLADYLHDENIRPLTDNVTVRIPDTVSYDVDLTYYVARSSSAQASTIQTEVEQAVTDYIAWQQEKIGRDINPSELIKRVVAAGAKRCTVRKPVFQVVSGTAIPKVANKTIVYGGVEDD